MSEDGGLNYRVVEENKANIVILIGWLGNNLRYIF